MKMIPKKLKILYTDNFKKILIEMMTGFWK